MGAFCPLGSHKRTGTGELGKYLARLAWLHTYANICALLTGHTGSSGLLRTSAHFHAGCPSIPPVATTSARRSASQQGWVGTPLSTEDGERTRAKCASRDERRIALAMSHTQPKGCRLAAAGLALSCPDAELGSQNLFISQASKFRLAICGRPHSHVEAGIRLEGDRRLRVC